MAEDAEKKILDWCGHLAVPRCVDEKSYNNCKACAAKMDGFIKKDKHHCRLCGQMFCSACTQKYHIPLIFRIKNKDGPARVCMSCVDGCMEAKAKAQAPPVDKSNDLSVSRLGVSSLATSQVSSHLSNMAKATEIVPPEHWQEEADFKACPKCRTPKCTSYNCRLCGLRYCDKCTQKMQLPACFERKAKTGPSRVCDPCRYRVVQGAKLVEKLTTGPATFRAGGLAPPPPGASSKERRPSSFANKCSVAGCTGSVVGAEGKCSSHATASSSSAPKPQQEEIKALVKREGDGSLVANLVIPSGESSLSVIDTLLKKCAPQSESYSYVFRGAPIPEAFHGVFLAKHLGTTLLIRPKHRVDLVSLSGSDFGSSGEESGAPSGAAGGGVPGGANNPFKRDLAKEAELAAARAKKAKPAPKPIEFKRPDKKKFIKGKPPGSAGGAGGPGSAPAGGGALGVRKPPPPPGSIAAGVGASFVPAGANLDETLKARSKKLFGAL